MKSFTIELVEGRPILKSDQEVIFLNTGWPTTLQNNREITLLGRHFNCFTTMAGVTLQIGRASCRERVYVLV